MIIARSGFIVALLLQAHTGAFAGDTRAFWDSRCEECHGDVGDFARKYLWVFDDQLQGQHHVSNLRLFMRNHYIPDHQIEAVHDMLHAQANTPARFQDECGECHDSAETFVRKSLFVRAKELTGAVSGVPVAEFLATHQELSEEDAAFYSRLLERVMIVVYGQ